MDDVVHEKAYSNIDENRGDIKISRDVQVHSRKLGIYGVCDIVEFNKDIIIPVEYKKGKPKEDNADIMQLVLQCMCLEEMYGFLYYDGANYI